MKMLKVLEPKAFETLMLPSPCFATISDANRFGSDVHAAPSQRGDGLLERRGHGLRVERGAQRLEPRVEPLHARVLRRRGLRRGGGAAAAAALAARAAAHGRGAPLAPRRHGGRRARRPAAAQGAPGRPAQC